MIMPYRNKKLFNLLMAAVVIICASAQADVKHSTMGSDIKKVKVTDNIWQPEPFKEGIVVPATYAPGATILVDGIDNESVWLGSDEVTVPLSFGGIGSAQLKALYTDEDVILRIRWADNTKDSIHRPWVWNENSKTYVSGTQVEDSLLLSFEAGCEWFPSFLSGYAFDFDAWNWKASRTDPLGLALDLSGSIKENKLPGNVPYSSRNNTNEWNLKFTDRNDGILHNSWEKLDRQYMIWPVIDRVFYGFNLDGSNSEKFTRQLPPPTQPPNDKTILQPQFVTSEVKGGAADVQAKGNWKDGFWTVELRRKLITKDGTSWDIQFERLTQFSIHVFDRTEQLDQSSESPRLFLQFIDKKSLLASH